MRDIESLISDEDSLRERFSDKVDTSGDCHIWTGSIDPANGYGRISVGDFSAKAHRVSMVLEGVDISDTRVLHNCHTKACVNPDHLRCGTSSDNTADEKSKGAFGPAKLTFDQVEEIRERYESESVTQAELGDEYGVGQDQISRIVNRKRWV
jgi:hypothetical protein